MCHARLLLHSGTVASRPVLAEENNSMQLIARQLVQRFRLFHDNIRMCECVILSGTGGEFALQCFSFYLDEVVPEILILKL